MRVVGRGQDDGALLTHGAGVSVVDVSGCVKAKTAMTMNVVVPGEETLAVSSGGFDRVEPLGEVGPVLQGLERRLRERVVIGHMRTRVGLGDAEVGQQERDRFRGHRSVSYTHLTLPTIYSV